MASRQWLYSAPSLDELADGVRLVGIVKRKSCAVIIPVHNEESLLKRHLDSLEGQAGCDFDVVLVHSPGFKPNRILEDRPYGIVVLSLKSPLGAGAFFAGQKYSIEQGYGRIILADVDALPQDRGLIGRLCSLVDTDDSSIFLPSIMPRAGKALKSWSIHWYGAMGRNVLLKSGLTFLPLFFGGEDTELELRMRNTGVNIRYLEGPAVDHPLSKPQTLTSAYVRSLYDFRNRGLMLFHLVPESWPIVPLSDAFFSLTFFDRSDRFFARVGMALHALRDMAALRLSQLDAHRAAVPAYEKTRLQDAFPATNPSTVVLLSRYLDDDREALVLSNISEAGAASPKIIRIDSANPACSSFSLGVAAIQNRALLLCTDWKHLFNPVLLLCPRICLHDGTGTWRVYHEPNPALRFARFIVSACAILGILALYLPVSFSAHVRLSSAMNRYGIGHQLK